MELASPVFPSLFLTLACLGSIARAITGTRPADECIAHHSSMTDGGTICCFNKIHLALTVHDNVYFAGVAAGSTRAALTLHFAKQNNAADISAKEGTQVHST